MATTVTTVGVHKTDHNVDQQTPLYLTRYNPHTYWGRVMTQFATTNPLLLLITDKQIENAKHVMNVAKQQDWELMKKNNITQEDVYKADVICKSLVHPQTQQKLSFLGTFPMFLPINVPILSGMLIARPTFVNNVFWQWINQTYNAVFNNTQANKSLKDTSQLSFFEKNKDIMIGYGGAVVVSISLALGLNHWLKVSNLSQALKSKLQLIIPYTAVASAGFSNIGLMRLNEVFSGVPVHSPSGEYIGHSKEAAKMGLLLSAFSRAILPIPSLLFPPFIFVYMTRFPLLQRTKAIKALSEISVLTFFLAFGLPLSTAMFPQYYNMKFEKLDKSLKEAYLSKIDAKPLTHVVFNKGL